MLLDRAHPETWTDTDRDAYTRWRLTDYAEWIRHTPKPQRLTLRAVLKGSVQRILDERRLGALTRPRYKYCRCDRCVTPELSTVQIAAYLVRHPESRTLRPRTIKALAYLDTFKGSMIADLVHVGMPVAGGDR